jgi:hypothetical protein
MPSLLFHKPGQTGPSDYDRLCADEDGILMMLRLVEDYRNSKGGNLKHTLQCGFDCGERARTLCRRILLDEKLDAKVEVPQAQATEFDAKAQGQSSVESMS